MSIIIGNASIDENGNITGGLPGDQTGLEVKKATLTPKPGVWTILRPIDENIAALIAQDMEYACDNKNIGYNQGRRHTLYSVSAPFGYDCSKVTTPCECDCSSLVQVCCLYAGVNVGAISTSNMVPVLYSTGRFLKIPYTGVESFRRGDILRRSGHTCVVLSNSLDADQNYAMDGSTATLDEMCAQVRSLYDVEVEKTDAILREVGYLDSNEQPSIFSSELKLSVINYTNMLGALFSIYAPVQFINASSENTDTNVNCDMIDSGVARQIFIFLHSKGLNPAAVCGILGNISQECSFNIACGLGGSHIGICQWGGSRKDAMTHMTPNWTTNLTGQLEYLWVELSTSYKTSTFDRLLQVPNTIEGVRQATYIFCKYFEKPGNEEQESQKRFETNKANKPSIYFWNAIVQYV